MCTYNGEKFIERQIQSILDQTHTDFNLIIIDDVSSDGTVEIIKKMMLSDSRIELHQNAKNLGYFDNFLFGLNYVKSDYLFFSDQDDVWLSNKIEIQLNDLIHENEKVLMNFSNSYLCKIVADAPCKFALSICIFSLCLASSKMLCQVNLSFGVSHSLLNNQSTAVCFISLWY